MVTWQEQIADLVSADCRCTLQSDDGQKSKSAEIACVENGAAVANICYIDIPKQTIQTS